MNTTDLKPDDQVEATLYGPIGSGQQTVIGTVIGTYTADGLRDPSLASANHTAIQPFLPNAIGTYQQYQYVLIRNLSGTLIEIGLPWINPSTLVIGKNKTLTLTISPIREADVSVVLALLASNGFSVTSNSIT